MYNNQDSSENHFLKLKLNVDEIVKKKITMLPKMKTPLADFSKKEKLNKLMKLVFWYFSLLLIFMFSYVYF